MTDPELFKSALITLLDTSRARMKQVLDGIDQNQQIYPPWTIKQVLAHITGWDDATTTSLQAHATGKDPGAPAARGIDHYNAQSVAERDALSYEHIVKEWELARQKLKDAINALPPEKLTEPLLYPWGQTDTVELIVRIMAMHEIEHAEEIENLSKDKEED